MKVQLQFIAFWNFFSFTLADFLDRKDFSNAEQLKAPKLRVNSEVVPILGYKKSFYRNMIRNRKMVWPGGILPYVLSGSMSDKHRAEIARSFQDFHDNTCVRYIF